MNRLVNETKRYTWSEQCKDLLGKYVEFFTNNGNYIRGFVISYTDSSDEENTIKIGDQFLMTQTVIRPVDLMFIANCTVYNLDVGTKQKRLEPIEKHQGSLIRNNIIYTFDYIDESGTYSFVDKKSGCIVFLTFSNVTKDKATVRMAGGFWEREFTAKEFDKTFDDHFSDSCCGCPCAKRYSEEE